MPKISGIKAKRILDSTGNWTIETTVFAGDGVYGIASVPSGESAGKYEAKKVPTDKAVELVNGSLNEALVGQEVSDQLGIDNCLITLDGTADKSKLGANTVLSVSEAVAEAGARSRKLPLFRFLAEAFNIDGPFSIPTPLFNILEGGCHANNELDFQEFLFIPSRTLPFSRQLEIGISFSHQTKMLALKEGKRTGVGDEGGLSVHGLHNEEALLLMNEVAKSLSLDAGKDVFFGIDAAAGQFYREGQYFLKENTQGISPDLLRKTYDKLLQTYQLSYLEDSFGEDDTGSWAKLVINHGEKTEVTGDDLTTSNLLRMEAAARDKLITAIIIKPNQVGTVSEAVKTALRAKELGLTVVASHRGAETNSSFIADLAVAIGAQYAKLGGLSRGERIAKFNRMLEIEQEIGELGIRN
ncbi:MAG: phosphopyruvate hydratase [Patescibacteria group bacterium]